MSKEAASDQIPLTYLDPSPEDYSTVWGGHVDRFALCDRGA